MKKNYTLWILIIIVLLVLGLSIFYGTRSDRVMLNYSYVPYGYDNAVSLFTFVPYNENITTHLSYLSEYAKSNSLPITAFITLHPVNDSFRNLAGKEAALNNSIFSLQNEFFEIQSSGLIEYPLEQMNYDYQERFMIDSRKFIKDSNNISGIFPLSPDYNSIIAAENAGYDYILLLSESSSYPYHPKSPAGTNMRIYIFPIMLNNTNTGSTSALYVPVNTIFDSSFALSDYIHDETKEKTYFSLFSEQVSRMKKIDKSTASYKKQANKKEAVLVLNTLTENNDTKIDILTSKTIINITDYNQNVTYDLEKTNNGYTLRAQPGSFKLIFN